jgi:hypothetical protein
LRLVLPAGGLLLGAKLISGGPQPRWAKVLAFLTPVLGPVLFVLVWGARQPDTREPEREHLTFYQPAFGGK